MTHTIKAMTIGLGGQRCGSTWLHEQLCAHPQIAPPGEVKEVHFFDRYWDRGPSWYAGLFGAIPDNGVLWESTPNYLYTPEAPERIAATVAQPRFVVLLRDPTTRSVSQYRRFAANASHNLNFAASLEKRRNIVRMSRYSEFLPAYINRFGREALHIAFYEDIAVNPEALLDGVARFMQIDSRVPESARVRERINAVHTPRYPRLHSAAEQTKRALLRSGMGSLVRLGRSAGLRRIVTGKGGAPRPIAPLKQADEELLAQVRREEVEALGALEIDASRWLDAPSDPAA